MITWRKITREDYNCILLDWWKAWDFPAPALEYLPVGYIINNNGVDVYAGFLYYTGTQIAWMEFVVSNRNASPELKKGCLEKLIDVISTIAKNEGVKVLFTSTVDMAFCNSLKKNDFVIGDVGNIQLTKTL